MSKENSKVQEAVEALFLNQEVSDDKKDLFYESIKSFADILSRATGESVVFMPTTKSSKYTSGIKRTKVDKKTGDKVPDPRYNYECIRAPDAHKTNHGQYMVEVSVRMPLDQMSQVLCKAARNIRQGEQVDGIVKAVAEKLSPEQVEAWEKNFKAEIETTGWYHHELTQKALDAIRAANEQRAETKKANKAKAEKSVEPKNNNTKQEADGPDASLPLVTCYVNGHTFKAPYVIAVELVKAGAGKITAEEHEMNACEAILGNVDLAKVVDRKTKAKKVAGKKATSGKKKPSTLEGIKEAV
tara:strand:+ start:458 stop:1354 length:897 start_codon:yes stop_codon:yes gene_type:complete